MDAIESVLTPQTLEVGADAWLIAYDIKDPRRLYRVHRLLKARGIPLQYSVFIAWITKRDIQYVVEMLEALINPKQDDVRLYHLPSRLSLHVLGRQWLPSGVNIYQNGLSLEMNTASGC